MSLPQFRPLRKDELPAGYDSGNTYKSVCINTGIYLAWLEGQCLRNGVVFRRGVLKHIADAAKLDRHWPDKDGQTKEPKKKADVIVNCTGLSARFLGGVEDAEVIPARGQTVLVRNVASAMCENSGTDDGEEEVCYTMQRAAGTDFIFSAFDASPILSLICNLGGGTILGGCYQKNNWSSQVDPSLAIRIMKRCVDICPSLTNGQGIEKLDVIRQGVGLRPLRLKGTRVEKEMIKDAGWVVHNYGHGGYGYQASYGSAQVAVKLVEGVLAAEPKVGKE